MNNEVKSVFRFNGYSVNKMTFLLNKKCTKNEFNLDFDMDVNFKYEKKDDDYIGFLTILVYVFKNAKKKDYPFELKLEIEGIFSAPIDCDKESFSRRMKQNGLAILFPYIRSSVADASKMANIQPLLLPSINIVKFLQSKEKEAGKISAH